MWSSVAAQSREKAVLDLAPADKEFITKACQDDLTLFHDEGAQTFGPFGGVGLREDQVNAGEACIDDPALDAIRHIIAAFLNRCRLSGRYVQAGAWLGKAEGPRPALEYSREEPALLIVVAGDSHAFHCQGARSERRAHGGTAITQLFQHKPLSHGVIPAATSDRRASGGSRSSPQKTVYLYCIGKSYVGRLRRPSATSSLPTSQL